VASYYSQLVRSLLASRAARRSASRSTADAAAATSGDRRMGSVEKPWVAAISLRQGKGGGSQEEAGAIVGS
jgi:hypothetical protein